MSIILADMMPSLFMVKNLAFDLAWLQSKLIFEAQPLGEVIHELERTHDITIELSVSRLCHRPCTGAFDRLTSENALLQICRDMILNSETIACGTLFLSEKRADRNQKAEATQPFREGLGEFVKPKMKYHIDPFYPSIARERDEQGIVHLLLRINKQGPVERVHNQKKRNGSAILDEAALSHAKGLKFKPARVHGHPVDIRLI